MGGKSHDVRANVGNRPQAKDDAYTLNEDGSAIRYLNVLANDQGGAAKSLWSVRQDDPSTCRDESQVHTNVGQWVTLSSGAKVAITADGRIAYDTSAINANLIQSLSEGERYTDSFTYTIRLGNGTTSDATVDLTFVGKNDAATITGTTTGCVTEAGASPLTFAAPVAYPVGLSPSPLGIGIGDVDNDGDIDIVTGNLGGPTFSALLNDGTGHYVPGPVSPATDPNPSDGSPSSPQNAVLADMNGDGRLDVVSAHAWYNSGFTVQLGDGSGAFAPGGAHQTGIYFMSQTLVGDIDHDHDMDIVVVGKNTVNQGVVEVWKNDSLGVVTHDATYTSGDFEPYASVLADMNGDGFLDIVVSNSDNSVSILLNDKHGTFGPPTSLSAGAAGPASGLAVADLNGDGELDIVTANQLENSVSLLLSDGAPGFGGYDPAQHYDAGSGVQGLAATVGDFDGDGDIDIAVSSQFNSPAGPDTVTVLLNDGTGAMGSPIVLDVGTGVSPGSLAAVDVDDDGAPDIVVANVAAGSVSVLMADGGVKPGSPYASGDLDITDVDSGQDHFAFDPAALQGTYGKFAFDANTGEWSYTLDNADPQTQALKAGIVVSDSLVVSSFDHTASATIAVEVHGANDVATITGTATGSVKEYGSGVVSFATAALLPAGYYPSPVGFAIADVNNDGNPDIVSADFGDDTMSVLVGDGVGNFGPRTSLGTFDLPQNAIAAYVNDDEYVDIVSVHGGYTNKISIALSDGTGGFSPPGSFTADMTFTNDAALADFDKDGDLDIAVVGHVNFKDSVVEVWLQDDGGGFTQGTIYAATAFSDSPNPIAVADMDDDGDIDIVVGNLFSSTVSVLTNNADGTFGSFAQYSTGGSYPGDLAIADLNGDGRPDIVTANQLSDNVSVLLADAGGGFSGAVTYAVGGDAPSGVAVADLDGDGDLDLVVSNLSTNEVSVLLNDGSGGFEATPPLSVGGTSPASVVAADLNGDGRADIVTADVGSDNLSMLLNTSTTTPGSPYASGDLDITDVDTGEGLFAFNPADLQGTYGTFTFDADSGAWSYALDNADPDTEALNADDVVCDFLTVTSFDGTASATIAVQIHGANDLLP